jgi:hypothetical protein
MDSRGSYGYLSRAHNTVGKSHFGKKDLTEGFELKMPIMKSPKLFSELFFYFFFFFIILYFSIFHIYIHTYIQYIHHTHSSLHSYCAP